MAQGLVKRRSVQDMYLSWAVITQRDRTVLHFAQHSSCARSLSKGTLSEYLLERLQKLSNVQILTGCELVGLEGDGKLKEISYRTASDNQAYKAVTNAVFLCIGGSPRTDWVPPGVLQLDAGGYILTGPDLAREGQLTVEVRAFASFLETNLSGVVAAGDVPQLHQAMCHGCRKECNGCFDGSSISRY